MADRKKNKMFIPRGILGTAKGNFEFITIDKNGIIKSTKSKNKK